MKKQPHRKRSKRYLEYSSMMLWQFHLLCKLTEKKPQDILHDFMCNVGMEGYGLGEIQRAKAMEYFLSCGYGQE